MSDWIIFENWPKYSHDDLKAKRAEYEKWKLKTLLELLGTKAEVARRLKVAWHVVDYKCKKYGI